MYPEYQDIRERAGEPDWYSGPGVPRYGEWEPGMVNVYSDVELLMAVECQACGQRVYYADGWSANQFVINAYHRDVGSVTEAIQDHEGDHYDHEFLSQFLPQPDREHAHYWSPGDMPYHEVGGEFCHAGCTMSAIPVEIEKCYFRIDGEWERQPDREYKIEA